MTLSKQKKKTLKGIGLFVFIAGSIALLYSVVKSGYYFQFNPDELFNANTIYLMLKGYKPYIDFYTVYSPLLHWLLTPLFLIYGITFEAVYASRILMIFLYLVRLLLLFLLVKKVFNYRAALIVVLFFMLDPFMVFSAMQIRPDNLMLVFYTLFLLLFSHTLGSKSAARWFLSGLLLGITLLINIKITPSVGVFGLVFLYIIIKRRLYPQFLLFVNGFCLIFLAFFSYFLVQGYAAEMFLHVFLDPFRLNNSIPYPTWLGYFYFSNPTIFGIDGKPLNWIFAWALPVMAFAGGYRSLFDSEKESENTHHLKIILFLSLVIQWLSMLFIHSVFIQYYLPLNWLYAIFAAVLVDDLLFKIDMPTIVKATTAILVVSTVAFLVKTSVAANLNRSQWTAQQQINEWKAIWKEIPQNDFAFPNVLFRKPIYPVLWGSTFSQYMRDRYPPAYLAIKKYNIPIMFLLNDEYFGYLDKESQDYIVEHYRREEGNIWRKVR